MTEVTAGRLVPGSENFLVEEIPLYEWSGAGEHLLVQVEKRNLTSDLAAKALAQACGVKPRAVSMAGRKDRHAVTSQWFSVHFGDESRLSQLRVPHEDAQLTVLAVTRHRNKLKNGHLSGNRFRLRVADVDADFPERVRVLGDNGWPNYYGQQRFGHNGANLKAAIAWANGDDHSAVSWLCDPTGGWLWQGDATALADLGFVSGPVGRVVGALRQGREAAQALRRGGDPLQRLLASSLQSAIANAVLDGRQREGLLHHVRYGDVALGPGGRPFVIDLETLPTTEQRLRERSLFVSVPMPGTWKITPGPKMLDKERAWSAAVGASWSALQEGPLRSAGSRRQAVVYSLAPPVWSPDSAHSSDGWLSVALPAGVYATEFLKALNVAVPTGVERAGSSGGEE